MLVRMCMHCVWVAEYLCSTFLKPVKGMQHDYVTAFIELPMNVHGWRKATEKTRSVGLHEKTMSIKR